jgi:hypothetical protein
MARTVVIAGFVTALLLGACLAPSGVSAIEPGSPACKRELQATSKKMQESLAVIDSVKDALAQPSVRPMRRRASSPMKSVKAPRAAKCSPSAPARCATPTT